MIGRADIEGSKSNVAKNAWLPQISYPCGKFSDTSQSNPRFLKGSIGLAFAIVTNCRGHDKTIFSPFSLRQISDLTETIIGHLWWNLTDVPPQPNSPPRNFLTLYKIHKHYCIAVSKFNRVKCCGVSLLPKLPHTLLHLCNCTKISQSQPQQGLLAVLSKLSPFPKLQIRWKIDRDSRNLINPFMRVTNQMTRHFATLKASQLRLPLTRAYMSLLTLTFKAPGRIHTLC